ncbi:FitA-like ribbon-helix-helix domain-containing protein [Bifidobacterium eulemuris]|uniref:Antitoxin FitA-like ribbon-helix-helix domain-containing protein n=1 Tax=Bifidobacterium eulemuris TaxID=1765219 RepID=A0A261G9V1_9BIFI|nr:hypothetical protein [Bifidobacterium eulemuris]OZG64243.1 hypothetical protein BEUL_2204 [Bifidobacterium eulemuris]OZG68188.1 hypothetical protein BEUL_1201 [Bifidobacterium eulemuris]QOL31755.1 hypothetical protein BE0216_04190 [Bifidobacterium eulemuris]QOL32831.1 hypothetical protein BE0216_10585 [Bifidobacterium eulemuris]
MTTSLLIRKLPEDVKETLAKAAKANGRSTEAQARSVLEEFAASWVEQPKESMYDFFTRIREEVLEGGIDEDEFQPMPRDKNEQPRPVDFE